MDKRFIVPAGGFLLGLVLWILGLIVYKSSALQSTSWWPILFIGLLPGLSISISAIACRRAGGPRVGNQVRAGVLLVLAVASFITVETVSAGLLLLAALVTGSQLFMRRPEKAD